MKIANIVYEKDLVNHTKVDYINYYNQQIIYDDLDKSLPTLYVGWSFMKQCNPNNEIIQSANILKKKIITNELYWEFSFEENKSSHVNGIEKFVNLVPQLYFTPKYQYVNLDPLFFQIADIEDLVTITPKEIDSIYLFKDDFLYLLKENKIWGINLQLYRYFLFDIGIIKNSFIEKSKKVFDDKDGELYITQFKIFPTFEQLKRYMVVILS